MFRPNEGLTSSVFKRMKLQFLYVFLITKQKLMEYPQMFRLNKFINNQCK